MISFVVPAHDEEALLPRTLTAIRAAAAPLAQPHEVIVVDDASNDRTAEVAREHGAVVVNIDRRQISAARNVGAREASGSTLIFVDADTTVTPEVVRAAVAAVDAGAAGGGAEVRFDGRIPWWATLALYVTSLAFRVIGLAAGCFVFCSREAFAAAGGFDEDVYVGEELYLSLRLKRSGRFVVLREHVVTSGRKLRTYSGFEIVKLMGLLAVRGRRGVRDRRNLSLWYGPRRDDPGAGPSEAP